VVAGAPLSVGRSDVPVRRHARAPGAAAVGAGEWLLVGQGEAVHVELMKPKLKEPVTSA